MVNQTLRRTLKNSAKPSLRRSKVCPANVLNIDLLGNLKATKSGCRHFTAFTAPPAAADKEDFLFGEEEEEEALSVPRRVACRSAICFGHQGRKKVVVGFKQERNVWGREQTSLNPASSLTKLCCF